MDTPTTLLEAVRYFSDLDVCEQYMVNLKWPDAKIVCPKCGGESIGRIPKRRKFKCNVKSCQCQWSIKTGTLMEDSPLPESQWLAAIWAWQHGISSAELSRAVGLSQPCCWKMLKRIDMTNVLAERRPIPGHPDYLVGPDGSIWSRRKWRGNQNGEVRPIKVQKHSRGYRCFTACLGGDREVSLLVHVCVLEAFVGPCPDGQEARHLDGDRANNRLDNLAWGTNADNHDDRRRHGTIPAGASHPSAKMSEADVVEARRLRADGMTLQAIADRLGRKRTTISSAVNGHSWQGLA